MGASTALESLVRLMSSHADCGFNRGRGLRQSRVAVEGHLLQIRKLAERSAQTGPPAEASPVPAD
jgi:hypothetical protein